MIGYLLVIFGVIAVFVTGWVLLRVCTHIAQPTDQRTRKYIMSDPWVQARLAQQHGAADPPDEEPQT
jgi:hypothetical protein